MTIVVRREATKAYWQGCADERARLSWWLRSAVDGPNNATPELRAELARLADIIDTCPERWADAPPRSLYDRPNRL